MAQEFTNISQIQQDRSWWWLRVNKCLYNGWLAPEDVPEELKKRFGDFHVWTNDDGVQEHRKTMELHKTTAEYITNSIFAEEPEIQIEGTTGKRILEILEENDFIANEIDKTETWIALGARLKNLIKENGKTVIDYIEVDGFSPTSWHSKEILGGVFVTQRTKQIDGISWHYTLLQWHGFGESPLELGDDGEVLSIKNGYFIKTQVYKSRTIDKLETSCFGELQNVFGIKTREVENRFEFEVPTFHYSTVPRKNNKVLRSPMGLGWFTNALDTAKSIDESFDGLSTEIDLGRKKVAIGEFGATESLGIDGRPKKTFRSKKRGYFVNFDTNDTKGVVQDISGPLRTVEIIGALNAQLDVWDFKAGLSAGTSRFDGKSISTATEIKTQQKESARTIKLLENALARDWKAFIVKLVKFHNITAEGDNLGEITDKDINIIFHDNIIIDENLEKEVFRAEIDLGVRAEWEYRVRFFGESTEEAKAFIDTEINTNSVVDDEFNNPLPKPSPDETEEDFIARFMSDEEMITEHPEEEQRLAIAKEQFAKGGS